MIEQALVVVEAEQQRADHLLLLGVAEAADDAVGGALLLDLDHRPLAGAVGLVEPLGDRRRRARRRCARSQPSATSRSEVIGESCRPRHRVLARRMPPALARRFASGWLDQRLAVELEQVEHHQLGRAFRRRACARGFRPDAAAAAARRTTSASPTGMISSPSSRKRLAFSAREHLDDLGEIAAERLARLGGQRDLVAVAAREAAEAVPLGLVLPALAVRQLGREQRLHRRRNGPSLAICRQSRGACSRSRCARAGQLLR